ncbi:helix-turn-helix transcriptional regulator [Curtobacterium sp. MCBA15_012]|uniref:helix-turn-helix domain-containing protein n=1 Tax=Curtobacterium sp. MCBA15_012 TaxID=1898738 RepID=UPI0009F29C6B|nr:helix-turn-helix transcriptional regulator [Curtobacterium sp. MCBA15_012]WIA99705.1 helix-turn-helix transcriptional regulator [Curtobacterium sp. MCBA15_012]
MATTTPASRTVADEVLAHLGRTRQTRTWLTEKTGIPIATMSRRLNAQSAFTIDELVSIAQALEVPLGEILAPITSPAQAAVAA